MKTLNIILYLVILSGCGFLSNKPIENKNLPEDKLSNEAVMNDDLEFSVDSLLDLDKTLNYPKISDDIFHLIPTQKIINGNTLFLDLQNFIYSDDLEINYIDNDSFYVYVSNDSLSITPIYNTTQLVPLKFYINGINVDILTYSQFDTSQIQTNVDSKTGIILKDSHFIQSNNLILDFYYLPESGRNSSLKKNATFILFDNTILESKYYHIFDDKIRIMLPDDMDDGLLRICSMNEKGLPLKENHTIISDGLPLFPNQNESSPYLSNGYYLIVDRFHDGNLGNNSISNSSIDKKNRFHGGDLIGLLKKIKHGYFNRLGIKNLIISPLNSNPNSSFRTSQLPFRRYTGFDGGWPIDSRYIDPRFGNAEELKKIIIECHDNQIGVHLDYIVGYTHVNHLYYKSNSSWYTLTSYLNEAFLSELDFNNIEVIEAITDDIIYWINEFNINSIRYSSFGNTSQKFWKYLNRMLYSKTNNDFKKHNTIKNQSDSQFNIDLYYKARDHFSGLNTNFYELNSFINKNLVDLGPINLMETSTGFNNQVRFISVADNQATFKDTIDNKLFVDSPKAVINAESYEKLFMFHVMNNTLPGIPLLFYGDEYGQIGAGGIDSKRDMKFQKQLTILESHLKSRVSKLNSLRDKYPSLSLGDFFVLRESNNYTVWLKSYYNEKVLIFFNLQDKTIELNIPLPFNSNKLISLLDDQIIELNNKNIVSLIIPPYKTGIFLIE